MNVYYFGPRTNPDTLEGNLRLSQNRSKWWPSGASQAPFWFWKSGGTYKVVYPERFDVPCIVYHDHFEGIIGRSEWPIYWIEREAKNWQDVVGEFVRAWRAAKPRSVQYKCIDNRPVLQVTGASSVWATPDNPWGFSGAERRIDTEEGVELFYKHFACPAAAYGVQGVMFWVPNGYHPRGCNYRSDGEFLYAHPKRTFHRLVEMLASLNMWVGVLMRPAAVHVPSPADSEKDHTVYLQPHAESISLASMRARRWRDVGVVAAYLDEVGYGQNDDAWATAVNEHLPIVFTEFHHLNVAPAAGVYLETGKSSHVWTPEWYRYLLRQVYPETVFFHKSFNFHQPTSLSYEAGHKLGYTPLIEDWLLAVPEYAASFRWLLTGKIN